MTKWIFGVGLITLLCVVGCVNQWPAAHKIIFDAPACIKPHSGYSYLTCREIEVEIDNVIVTIPASFNTDLASIPRWYWSFLSPAYSGFIAPSILHDYLYGCPNGRRRYEIDSIFYNALRADEVGFPTAIKMYFAVRVFGHSHYDKNRVCLGQVALEKSTYIERC